MSDHLHLVIEATRLAEMAHRGQLYGKAPYIRHPIAVAEVVAYGGGTAVQVAAALLHDVIEDTDFTHADVAEVVGTEVADLVQALTHGPDVPYDDYVAALPDDAVLVKWADSTCNLRSLPRADMSPQRKAKLMERYRHNLDVLDARMAHHPSHMYR